MSLLDGLLHWYDFDLNLTDKTGHRDLVQYQGGPIPYIQGRNGLRAVFDGTIGLNWANTTPYSPIVTVAMWASNSQAGRAYEFDSDGVTVEHQLWWSNTNPPMITTRWGAVYGNPSWNWVAVTGQIHLYIAWIAADKKIWLRHNDVESQTSGTAAANQTLPIVNLNIFPPSGTTIDQLIVWDRILDQGERDLLWNGGDGIALDDIHDTAIRPAPIKATGSVAGPRDIGVQLHPSAISAAAATYTYRNAVTRGTPIYLHTKKRGYHLHVRNS
jgi:hypothetical protein